MANILKIFSTAKNFHYRIRTFCKTKTRPEYKARASLAYSPRAQKDLLRYKWAHSKIIKRGIVRLFLESALRKLCIYNVQASFGLQFGNFFQPASLGRSSRLLRKLLFRRWSTVVPSMPQSPWWAWRAQHWFCTCTTPHIASKKWLVASTCHRFSRPLGSSLIWAVEPHAQWTMGL